MILLSKFGDLVTTFVREELKKSVYEKIQNGGKFSIVQINTIVSGEHGLTQKKVELSFYDIIFPCCYCKCMSKFPLLVVLEGLMGVL